jgi:hypothetical protein
MGSAWQSGHEMKGVDPVMVETRGQAVPTGAWLGHPERCGTRSTPLSKSISTVPKALKKG